jgi:hypothetical protein
LPKERNKFGAWLDPWQGVKLDIPVAIAAGIIKIAITFRSRKRFNG